jgi:4-amino-4-deoxychorismate lyase
MSQFFETIKYCHGEFFLLDYHQERLNMTRREAFGSIDSIDLTDFLINPPMDNLIYRCRVSYNEYILAVEFFEYQVALHRTIKFIEAGNYEYSFKSEDRKFLNDSLVLSGADDVVFIKNGKLTDATYANIAFYKKGKWHTPDTFLLNGVKRRFLIHQALLIPLEISVEDLQMFEKIAFINAMRDFELVYSFCRINDKLELTLIQ